MSERITPAMVTSATLNDLNSSLAAMERTTDELSSGKTILEPSDNPYGASQVIDLQSQLDGLSSYATATQDGISWTNTASSALSSINSVVARVREMLVEAANGTNNQSDLNTVAQEVEQLTESVKQDANTQYAGQYVFSGTSTTTAPYQPGAGDEYQGNHETISRAIGPGATVTVSGDISTLLGNGEASGDGKLLDTLRTVAADMRSGNSSGVADLSSNQLTNLQNSLNTLEQMQANVGAATDRLTYASTAVQNLQTSDTAALSNDEDANMAQTMTNYSNEQAAFTAALRAGADIVQSSLMDFLSN
jgi:flagellar hook-associated protein 3 FlgL